MGRSIKPEVGSRKIGLRLITIILAMLLSPYIYGRNVLFSNGKSNYDIYVSANASVSEKTAAKELQQYILQISGTELPITQKLQATKNHIFVGYNDVVAERMKVPSPQADDEGFTYCTKGSDLYIYGGADRGTMYGVYSFLEQQLSVRWYTKDCTQTPKLKSWTFSHLSHHETPYIKNRYIIYYGASEKWSAHNKENNGVGPSSNIYGGLKSTWGVHTLSELIPSATYFASHPEYFSLREGKRIGNGQYCLSNKNVLDLCIKRLREVIAKHPDFDAYSVSQNDNEYPCECRSCKQIETRYGGHSGLMIWFINQVADAIKASNPGKYVETLAYTYTQSAPSRIQARENVIVKLCDIRCCFAHPLETCKENKPFMNNLKEWTEVTRHIRIMDYVSSFRYYMIPFPNFHSLASNIRTFGKYNNIGVIETGQYQTEGGEFAEMKRWILAKLLWNPSLDTDSLAEDFINGYYGKAATYIKQYYYLSQSQVKASTHMYIDILHDNKLYTDDYIRQSDSLLAKAYQAVGNDAQMRKRVDYVRLPIMYTKLGRSSTTDEACKDGTYLGLLRLLKKYKTQVGESLSADRFIEVQPENIKKSL